MTWDHEEEEAAAVLRDLDRVCQERLQPLERQWWCAAAPIPAGTPLSCSSSKTRRRKSSRPGSTSLPPQYSLATPPTVLVVGDACSGKSTVIQRFLGRSFLGARIGPTPSLDGCWRVVLGGSAAGGREEGVVLGDGLVQVEGLPFQGLPHAFGASFLNHVEASVCNASVLKRVMFVEAPALTLSCPYDYASVLRWFAERSDMILVVLDALQPSFSANFHAAVGTLPSFSDRLRIIVNKSDALDPDDRLKCVGALMWSAGRALRHCKPIPKCFVVGHTVQAESAESENDASLLAAELSDLPLRSVIGKIKGVRRRAERLRAHVYVADFLKGQMPRFQWWGKEGAQERILTCLGKSAIEEICSEHGIAAEEAPSASSIRSALQDIPLSALPRLDDDTRKELDRIIEEDIREIVTSYGGSNKRSDCAATATATARGSLNAAEQPEGVVEKRGEGGLVRTSFLVAAVAFACAAWPGVLSSLPAHEILEWIPNPALHSSRAGPMQVYQRVEGSPPPHQQSM